MFKKTEESEWTRFSRALQSQPTHQDEAVEPDEDDTGELSAATGRARVPEATPDELPSSSYARAEPAYAPAEPAYERPEPAYAPAEPEAYQQDRPSVYAEPTPAPISAPAPAPISAPVAASDAPPADSVETVLGAGASLEGTLRSDRSIRIRGFLSGEIESRERVIVEGSARVEDRIVAQDVTVIGEAKGQIDSARRVKTRATGRGTPDVRTGRPAN